MSDAPSGASTPRGSPAYRRGAASADTVPRMEMVRVTEPDLQRRDALEKTRNRLVYTAFGFALLFLAVIAKLADATILQPLAAAPAGEANRCSVRRRRKPLKQPSSASVPMITDRNGQILAISLPTVAVFADPRQVIDPADAAHRLKQVLPRLDEDAAPDAPVRAPIDSSSISSGRSPRARSSRSTRSASRESISARPRSGTTRWAAWRRRCWAASTSTNTASPASRSRSTSASLPTATPLRLSIDVRVQAVVRDELSKAMDEFQAIGACGIVMDVNTGEVLAMVSLPDYDANDFRNDARG